MSTTFNATDAKNRFGEMLDAAQTAPVMIRKNGREVAVVLSPEAFRALADRASGPSPAVRALHERSAKRFRAVYEALAK